MDAAQAAGGAPGIDMESVRRLSSSLPPFCSLSSCRVGPTDARLLAPTASRRRGGRQSALVDSPGRARRASRSPFSCGLRCVEGAHSHYLIAARRGPCAGRSPTSRMPVRRPTSAKSACVTLLSYLASTRRRSELTLCPPPRPLRLAGRHRRSRKRAARLDRPRASAWRDGAQPRAQLSEPSGAQLEAAGAVWASVRGAVSWRIVLLRLVVSAFPVCRSSSAQPSEPLLPLFPVYSSAPFSMYCDARAATSSKLVAQRAAPPKATFSSCRAHGPPISLTLVLRSTRP